MKARSIASLLVALGASLLQPITGLAQSGAGLHSRHHPGCHGGRNTRPVRFTSSTKARVSRTIPPRTAAASTRCRDLFAGNYTVTFTAPGMKKYQTSVALQDAQNAVLNPKLTVGDVAEQVTGRGGRRCSSPPTIAARSARNSTASANRPTSAKRPQRAGPGAEHRARPGGQRHARQRPHEEGMEYSQDGAPMTNRNFGGEANSAQATLPDPGFRAGSQVRDAQLERAVRHAGHRDPDHEIRHQQHPWLGVRNRAQQRHRHRQSAAESRQLRRASLGAQRIRRVRRRTHLASRNSTTARTSPSSSSPTSASRCGRRPTNW